MSTPRVPGIDEGALQAETLFRPPSLAARSRSPARSRRSFAALSLSWSSAAPMLIVRRNRGCRRREDMLAHLLPNGLGEGNRAFERGLGEEHGELLAAVAGVYLVADEAGLDEAGQIHEHRVADGVAVIVVDLPEVVDVEEEDREVALVAAAAGNLALERLVEVPLVVDLGQAIHDGHAVDLLVVPSLRTGAREELEHGLANPDLVAVLHERLAGDALAVDPRATGAAVVDNDPPVGAALDVSMVLGNRVALQHGIVVALAAYRRSAFFEHEAFAEQRRLPGVDDDQTVLRGSGGVRVSRAAEVGEVEDPTKRVLVIEQSRAVDVAVPLRLVSRRRTSRWLGGGVRGHEESVPRPTMTETAPYFWGMLRTR